MSTSAAQPGDAELGGTGAPEPVDVDPEDVGPDEVGPDEPATLLVDADPDVVSCSSARGVPHATRQRVSA